MVKSKDDFTSTVLGQFPSPIIILNLDTSIKYVNTAFEELTGFSAAELVGIKPPYPWWQNAHQLKYLQTLKAVMLKGRKVERHHRKKSSETFWVEITSKPVIVNGKHKYLIASWIDITKQKEAEKALLESEEFSTDILKSAPNPIEVINADTSLRYVNPALEELTGYSASELIGKKLPYPWWYKEDYEWDTNKFKAVMSGKAQKMERRRRKKNGESFWVEITSRPVIVNNEYKYFIANWVDITERKKAEEDLNRLTQELQKLSSHLQSVREQERAEISRAVHDELGQALTALKMDACWIRKKLDKDKNELSKIVDEMIQLIDITLQKTKWFSIGLRPALLAGIGLDEAIELLLKEFQMVTGISCRSTITINHNNLSQDHAGAIFRILQEILTNIFRHSKATRTTITLEQSPESISLRVFDNGRGITKDEITDLKSFGIMGIRERAHYFGGFAKITGIKNRGTKVIVSIPLNSGASYNDKDISS